MPAGFRHAPLKRSFPVCPSWPCLQWQNRLNQTKNASSCQAIQADIECAWQRNAE